MSGIISIGLNKDKIQFNEKGWANVTLFVDNETNEYGQNVSAVMEQSKEQREAKEARTYIGNGRVVFTNDGSLVAAERKDEGVTAAEQSQAGRETPDLPF